MQARIFPGRGARPQTDGVERRGLALDGEPFKRRTQLLEVVDDALHRELRRVSGLHVPRDAHHAALDDETGQDLLLAPASNNTSFTVTPPRSTVGGDHVTMDRWRTGPEGGADPGLSAAGGASEDATARFIDQVHVVEARSQPHSRAFSRAGVGAHPSADVDAVHPEEYQRLHAERLGDLDHGVDMADLLPPLDLASVKCSGRSPKVSPSLPTWGR